MEIITKLVGCHRVKSVDCGHSVRRVRQKELIINFPAAKRSVDRITLVSLNNTPLIPGLLVPSSATDDRVG